MADPDPAAPEDQPQQQPEGLTAREQYNVISDTVTGVNVRLKDNLIQAAIIAVVAVLGAIVGALLVEERLLGAAIGAFAGLVVGLIVSGIALMIFRGMRHLRGRHD